MAENQDVERKPKATLIKHRKETEEEQKDKSSDSTGSESGKKKVVVRVKRKPQGQSPQVRLKSTPSKSETAEEKPATQKASEDAEPKAAAPKPVAPKPQPKPASTTTVRHTARDESKPPRGPVRAGVVNGRSSDGRPRGTGNRPAGPRKAGVVGGRRVDTPERGRSGDSRGPRGPRSDGGASRPGGFRPRTGPPRTGPGGAPGGGPGGRSSGPPGGAPGGAPAGGNKGKKFFKQKKKEYPKRERNTEKELHYKSKKAVVKTNPVPKSIDIMEVITVSELARKMNLKASDVIGKLMGMGMMVTINQQIDAETAEIVAGEFGAEVNIVSLYDETIIESENVAEDKLLHRPPVVTVMGHVDHGKTKLLDAIRSTDVVAGEFGGITQHIGAYQVELESGKVTFLDTPGHAAFSMMRSRGAQVTDIVILVVAANDGVMPQTVEAINHAKAARVPIIVAVNKVDLEEANPDRVKQQLSEHELIPEEWGGSTQFVHVSALKREGVSDLLEQVLLQAEILELRASPDVRAEGRIIEARVDQGRGIVATALVQQGTLRVGDPFVAGVYPGRIRAMFNERGDKVSEAGPSTPVEILGATGIPNAGDPFQVTESEKFARNIGDKRQELRKVEEARNVKKVTLDNIYEEISAGAVQELKVVLKGDVHGSVEAIENALEELSTPEVRLNVIHATAGAINESDIMLASASEAVIIGFNVRPTGRAQQVADQEKVEIKKYSIIYDVIDDIRSSMEGMLAPELQETVIGTVEVRDTFKVPRIGVIAGCMVTSGKVTRDAGLRIFREGNELHKGRISSLRRFKDDVKQVDAGYECGIGIDKFQDVQVGDLLEIFQEKEIARKLGEPSGQSAKR